MISIKNVCLLDEEVALLPFGHADGALSPSGPVHQMDKALEADTVIRVALVGTDKGTCSIVETY